MSLGTYLIVIWVASGKQRGKVSSSVFFVAWTNSDNDTCISKDNERLGGLQGFVFLSNIHITILEVKNVFTFLQCISYQIEFNACYF